MASFVKKFKLHFHVATIQLPIMSRLMQASQNDQIIVDLGNVGIIDSGTEGKSIVQLRLPLSYVYLATLVGVFTVVCWAETP